MHIAGARYMYIWVMWSAKVIEMLIEDDSKIADRKKVG